jgi:uncharacterized protein (DUF885 family)
MDRRAMLIRTAAALAVAASARALAQSKDSSATESPRLRALFDQFMKENLDISPTFVTSLGLDNGPRAKQKSELDDGSEAGIDQQKALLASQLARMRTLDRSTLRGNDALNYDIVMYGLVTGDAANKAFSYGTGGAGAPYVLSQLTGCYQQIPSFLDNQHTIENRADADAYLARLSAFATLLDQECEVARHDISMKVIPPDFALAKTLAQMKTLRAPTPAQASLTQSVARRAKQKHIPGDYGARAASIVRDHVYPALDRQIAVIREMQGQAGHAAGVARLPDGDAYYAASVTQWTTTTMKAEEIHRIGLELVKDHTARIDALMRGQGMTRGTVGERLNAMYKDPRFLYPNTDEAKAQILVDLNKRVQSVRAKLPAYFGTLPRANVEIKRVPKEIEAGQSGGYYNTPSLDGRRPGIYWVNLRDTSEIPMWTLPTLTYHESIPGHHLQLSIQQEADLPLIRKVIFYSAYSEGWALYAEQLAAEMGEYDSDPLGHIGQLHDSMLRAVRLVLDSGIHGMNWSREQSVKYFTDTLGDPEATGVTEVERYCVWPGQGCAYMLGKLKLLSVRDQAKQTMSAKYDVRKFHDAMLLPGAVPLDLLDKMYA